VTTTCVFPPVPRSTRAARRFVLHTVGEVPARVRDAILVMVSELAMNAVQHARTEFAVRVDIAGRLLRVEVSDAGAGTPQAHPMPPPASPAGRGLSLVERLSDRWGVLPACGRGRTTVWFELSLPAPAGVGRP
jgi:anti-sigma regulatory factor (Ser/Thr protein kinase)